MRMSQADKERSHERIVASAARLFRERGLAGTSVGDVMTEAGMTHGGFYKHFESKDALVASAIEAAFAGFITALEAGDAQDAYARYRALYLSEDHRTHPQIGCPVATLAQDISRSSEDLRDSFGSSVRRLLDAIAKNMRGPMTTKRSAAIREFSMMVGAIVIARASDNQTAAEVLAACRGSNHNV
jgi:TetR/AcrR family transcriptional repressor of nem operon